MAAEGMGPLLVNLEYTFRPSGGRFLFFLVIGQIFNSSAGDFGFGARCESAILMGVLGGGGGGGG